MNIKIYQINRDRDEKNALFLRFESLEKFTGNRDVDSSIYDKVYEGNVECKSLESVFTKFNEDRPPEFTGHSLSVSDVVEICEGNESEEVGFYFCDSIGFKKIEFDPEKTQEKEGRKIKVVMVEPGKEARVVDLFGDLPAMQHAVQGDIEQMCPFDDQVAIVCNGEGKMVGLPLNRAIYMEGQMVDIVAGNFFICAIPPESEHYESLSDEQAKRYLEMFKEPERFYRGFDGRIQVQKVKRPLDEAIAEYKQSVSEPEKGNNVKKHERDM